jgi:hypothetical protein
MRVFYYKKKKHDPLFKDCQSQYKNSGAWRTPNGQYSQLLSLMKKLLLKILENRFILHQEAASAS